MSNYIPPQVTVEELRAPPTVSPIIASASDIVLVGPTQGYQLHRERVTLTTAGQQIKLPYLQSLNASAPESASLVEVVEVNNYVDPQPKPYEATADYHVEPSNNSIGIASSGSTIPANTTVLVTYKWLPSSYFFPQRFTSIAQIEATYGPRFDPTGSKIASPVSFAANLCLGNGAGSVIIQPLFYNEVEGEANTPKKQPHSGEGAEKEIGGKRVWSDSLELLRNYVENVDFVVPVVGQSMEGVGNDTVQYEIYQEVEKFLVSLNQEEVYAHAIFGDDSSSSAERGQEERLWTNATNLRSSFGGTLSEQIIYVNGSKYQVSLPQSSAATITNFLAVGGQYMAAAVAGALAGRPISNSLTRKAIGGFTNVLDQRTKDSKNLDAEHGLLVIEQVKGVIRCRHAITLDSTSVARSEISVVRAKFNLISSIKETLENQVIGQIIADANSPFVVRSAISGVLSALQQRRVIVDFSTIDAEISSVNPTVIKARFSYRPAFTLNYIEVGFALDMTAQTITATNGAPQVI